MPNEALIEALEQLRDTYNQRQKATNSLLTALKRSNTALNKANRTLRDYADQNPNRNNAAIMQAQDVFGALRLKEEAIDPLMPDLRREVKALTKLVAALRDALAALRGEIVDVVKLGHSCDALQAAKIHDPALVTLLPELDQELQRGQITLGETFGVALRHALSAQGLELGGRPPRFEIGPFEVDANFVNHTATLSYGKNLISKRTSLSIEAILKAYQRETKTIMGRNEDGSRWIEQLHTAWEAVRRKRGISEPRANIVECYIEMVLLRQPRIFRSAPSKHSFTDYSRAQFAYDFFQFTNEQPAEYKGLRAFGLSATKSQTDSAERSIWIVEGDTPYDGRYIADVKFDRDE
ncbi:MAG: hypothetical protein MI924_01835 [Chloroflexales bacterium]|nr:hypothetical protein [Chloroflexales bacterium]